jgi:DNA-binding response OmpR family regulator
MRRKVLVVDDDKVTVALVKFGLKEQDFQVVVAYNGMDGLQLIKEENPDLVILDISMPQMDGYDFVSQLRRLKGFENIPIIVLTASQNLQDVFSLEGIQGYFVKPVHLVTLMARVKKCLGMNDDQGDNEPPQNVRRFKC